MVDAVKVDDVFPPRLGSPGDGEETEILTGDDSA
jgi:hypothetical protein